MAQTNTITSQYTEVYLSLGANLGDRIATLTKAITKLIDTSVLTGVVVSRFYETEPVGYTEQPPFVNIVIRGRTRFELLELYICLKDIERECGRVERPRWHERELDIDILYFGTAITQNKNLTIPHPRLHQRKFVLVPLFEVAPYFLHPELRNTTYSLLEKCDDTSDISPIE
jgi:2-amino-4-hydroxy-6-hydroxymethyldihydropteridine diphosphokinase